LSSSMVGGFVSSVVVATGVGEGGEMRKKKRDDGSLTRSLRKRLRAVCVLVLLRAVLQGAYDDKVKWILEVVPEGNRITCSFDIDMLDSDIVMLENLSDSKIKGILSDAECVLEKHCRSWDEKWWKKLGRKKPNKSERNL